MTANTVLTGQEKWLAIADARKKAQKEVQKTQPGLLPRNSGLVGSAVRSQYFVDKYPLIEKTREERRNALEKLL